MGLTYVDAEVLDLPPRLLAPKIVVRILTDTTVMRIAGICFVALCSTCELLSAARFEPLFPIDHPFGVKSIFISADGRVVMARRTGGKDTQVWSQGVVTTLPYRDFLVHGLLGNGDVISGPNFVDASYDGSVKISSYWMATGIAPQAISTDGSTVVGRISGQDASGPWLAYRQSLGGNIENLGTLPGAFQERAMAMDVSANGSVIVGWSTSQTRFKEAFIWTAGKGMVGLGNIGGVVDGDTTAFAISADATTVVGSGSDTTGPTAFIWSEALGMRSLQQLLRERSANEVENWQLLAATDTSADGRFVVGYGRSPDNKIFAWRADLLVPEPTCSSLVLLIVLRLVSSRRGLSGSAPTRCARRPRDGWR